MQDTMIKRRRLLQACGAAALGAPLLNRPARAAAQHVFKIGHDVAGNHPMHLRLQEAADRIAKETQGRFELRIFPNNQLGGDSDMLAQVRSGSLEMAMSPDVVLSTLVPMASISGVGFAFAEYGDVWKAMDGDLGALVRKHIAKVNLQVMDRIWDNGFRQVTSTGKPITRPADLHGMKIRVPSSQMWISMFKALGAAPTAMNSSEIYPSLQTRVVEGQENPLINIFTQKYYEVQKYCSLTNHMWGGFWVVMNSRAWSAVPKDIQEIVSRHINQSAMDQRTDIAKMGTSLQDTLTGKGMVFNSTAPTAFREALAKAGYYNEWKKKFGDENWAVLARYSSGVA